MDFKMGRDIEKIPEYSERLSDGYVIDFRCRRPDTFVEYKNTFMNSCFYGLNRAGKKGRFMATMVDEAEAFTLHIEHVAILPKDLLLDIINSVKKLRVKK